MKKVNILYWLCTGMLFPGLGIGSVFGIMMHPGATEPFIVLGYPTYLAPFLGVARLLGLAMLVVPNYPRLREWAYAGFAFDITGVIYSQLVTAQPFSHVVIPIISLLIVGGSYFLYHKKLEWKMEQQGGVTSAV